MMTTFAHTYIIEFALRNNVFQMTKYPKFLD